MIHKMRLNKQPFEMIKNGTKTIEMRLNDEKRQLIKINDIIEFENRDSLEIIRVKVINLYRYKDFCELYKHFNKRQLGYNVDDIFDYHDMEKYYSIEEQEKYGVLGIEVTLL